MTQEHITSARDYLNSTGEGYLNFINGISPESLSLRIKELYPLLRFLPLPKLIVSVGVGQGEEVHSLVNLYDKSDIQVIGVDLSDLALKSARQRALEHKLPASFVLANAANLPFENNTVSGVVLSSVLHEVYSYFPSGFETWNQTIRGSARILEEGGCLLLRDSAAPDFIDNADISFKNELARQFYEYFRSEFRAFSSWDSVSRESLRNSEDLDRKNLPAVSKTGNVVLSQRYSAELLFHFFTFWKGYVRNVGRIGNINWTGLNEAYYLPYPSNIRLALSKTEYIEKVLGEANQELADDGFEMVCIEGAESVRPVMDEVMQEYFDVKLVEQNGNPKINTAELKNPFSRKMELVFRKVKL